MYLEAVLAGPVPCYTRVLAAVGTTCRVEYQRTDAFFVDDNFVQTIFKYLPPQNVKINQLTPEQQRKLDD